MPENQPKAESVAFAEFVNSGSEAAFALVVKGYLPLVLGTALRLTAGQRSLAEDVSQIVFADLAKKAKRVRAATVSAWLYKHTCFTASKAMRSERRRIKRERSAAAESQPSSADSPPPIDELLAGLGSEDREALFLRYVEGRSHEEVADVLGISRAAAQKRSERALGRLRSTLAPSLSGAGLLAMLTAPVAEGATLVPTITSSAVGVTTGKVAFFAKPVAGVIWGAATAITLSSVPLSMAWKEYRRESIRFDRSVHSVHKVEEPAPVTARATAGVFGSAAEVVSALIDLNDRFGFAQASKERAAAMLENLPPEWAHDVIVQFEKDLPVGARNTDWHIQVRRGIAQKWEPRQVPEDLITVWPMFGSQGMDSLFKACARVDLPATRKFLDGFQTETRLGYFHQPNGPHCMLAGIVIEQALKDCPDEVGGILDHVPRMDFIGYEWKFPGADEIRDAASDPELREILERSVASMKDPRRRRAFQRALYARMSDAQFEQWLEEKVEPARQAEAVTMRAKMEEASLAWWEERVPQSMQAELAGVLAEQRFNDQAPVLAWMERIGEGAGGGEFDLLRANMIASINGTQKAEPIMLADIAARIVDPSLRAAYLGEVLRRHARRSEPLRNWMDQNLDEVELEAYQQIAKKIPLR